MLVAVDTNGTRYISTDTVTIHREKGFYLCQECKQPIYLRLCLNKTSHFAHYPDDKECSGTWEPDTEIHSMMKHDAYDYFKKFSWVKRIELEYPIDIKEKIYLPDIYIETDQNHKIAIECQAHITTRDALLKRALTYAEDNIYPLFILEAGEFLGEFIVPRDDLYISPRFEEKSEGEEAFIQRFYIYGPDRESLNSRKDVADLSKDVADLSKDTIYSIDITFARIPSSAPIGTHIETCETKTDFSSYKINVSKIKYHSKDELIVNEIPMVADMQLPRFNFERIAKLRQEEELRERLRQQTLTDNKKEEGLAIVDKESQRNKEEKLQRKREEEIRKRDELRLQNLKEKLESIDIDEPWALYANYTGVSSPTLLHPLAWKNGDQVSNLKSMLTFFKKFAIPDKTKIMIYKSVCGSGKCCGKDTLILTSKGIVRIENIVKGNIIKQKTIDESLIEEDINVDNKYIGSTVKSFDIDNIKLGNDIISNLFDMGENDILEIVTKSGFNIRCTPTHKLIVIDDSCSIIFKDAKDISVGDSVAIASGTNIYGEDASISSFYQSDFCRRYMTNSKEITIPEKINEDIAELLGYAVSEGDMAKSPDERITRIHNDESMIQDRITAILSNLGIQSKPIYDDRREKIDGNEIDSIIFCDFMKYIGYIDGSENKEVPWSILQSSEKIQTIFLKALFSGDGTVYAGEDKIVIEYYTISKKLAEHVHIMLLNMGIFSSLSAESAICRTEGYKKDCGICYRVSIYGKYDIIKYINTIGFIQDYKKERCEDIINILKGRDFSYQSRTVKGSYIRLKRIYEEFKKLASQGKVIKTWKENVSLGNKTVEVERHKSLSCTGALKERGFLGGNIGEWLDGSYSASKRQVLKLLRAMKECYYLEDFKYLYNIVNSNIEFDIIKEKRSGRDHVYDCTIEKNHSYIGNGFINHNSATILHTVRGMGRGIIVTPFKALQRQYFDDYFKGNKFVMKKDGTAIKVAVLLGRRNFECKWLAEQYDYQQRLIEESKKPENIGMHIPIDDFILNTYRYDKSTANRRLPCTRPLQLVRSGKRGPRWITASRCPYWIPTPMSKETIDQWQRKAINEKRDLEEQFSEDITGEGENISDIQNAPSKKKTRLDAIQERLKCSTIKYYDSVAWGQVGIFIRDEVDKDGNKCSPVCQYYQQFYSYVDADVIVMNSAKWHLETRIGRKPLTDVEVFDEGDYWLDSQASEIEFQRSILDRIVSPDNKMQRMKTRALEIFDLSLKDIKVRIEQQRKIGDGKTNIVDAKTYNGLFTAMTETLVELIKSLEDDERIEEKLVDINTILRYIDKASISYSEGKRKETKIIKIFIPYPDYILKELFALSSKNIIITSGTMHNGNVLSTLFGINADNYVVDILQGREKNPGKLIIAKPKDGLARVTYSLWENSPQFKEWYNKTLNYILDNLKIKIDQKTGKPGEGKIILLTPAKKYAEGIINRPDVHVDFAKSSEEDDMSIKINTTLSDYVNNTLEDVRKIKEDDINIDGDVLRTNKQIILSTRLVRGSDLRDNKCRAVVMTKWPYPDVSAGYNQALKKRFGSTIFDKIMSDKAEREGIQYVSRGLRHDLDWEIFSSPDEKAYNNVFRLFSYDK